MPNADKNVETFKFTCIDDTVGMQSGRDVLKTSLAVSFEVKDMFTMWTSNPAS